MSGGVILTGAAGFIGEHLSQHLAARGIDHGAVFRVAPETATSHRTEHVGDLLDGSFTEDALSGYDTVVHLAGRTGGGQLESPEEFVRANVETTAAVQRAAKQAGVGRVIVASSYEAYGTPQQSPLDEDHPLEPASIYGVSMAAREMIARQLGEAYGIETILLRLFTVYGEPVSERNRKGAVAIFVKRVREGQALTLMGPTGSLRDFIYVGDVVRCLENCITKTDIGSRTINVGSGVGTSVEEIVESLSGRFPDLSVTRKDITSDGYDVVASGAVAREVLEFECDYTLSSAIDEMLGKRRT